MKPHQVFFSATLFFLLGVFFKSLGVSSLIILVVLVIAGTFLFLWKLKDKKTFLWLSFLSLFVFLGALYYTAHDLRFKNINITFGQEIEFSGVVVNNPTIKDECREFALELNKPLKGKILVKVSKYPKYEYGDQLKIKGRIGKPKFKGYRDYLAGKGISGVAYSPEIKLVGAGGGSPIKSVLYSIRNRMDESFQKVLPPREAAFLNGLTFGGYGGMTKDFKTAMKESGTTHLVALSGYNISIIIWVVLGIFIYFFNRRISFILTGLFIAAFVIMTGAEASVIRAAIMGILVLVADRSGRFYDMKNALIFSAFLMTFQNPKVLLFDVGFQLSFLAVLGIVYLKPALQKLAKMKETPGFLSWRDNLFTTASAQLMVLPILVLNFDTFSSISLLANVIILELIPITMTLGFVIGFVSLISYYLSLIFGWFTAILLYFETGVIKFFAGISPSLNLNFNLTGLILYYLIIAGLIWTVTLRKEYV